MASFTAFTEDHEREASAESTSREPGSCPCCLLSEEKSKSRRRHSSNLDIPSHFGPSLNRGTMDREPAVPCDLLPGERPLRSNRSKGSNSLFNAKVATFFFEVTILALLASVAYVLKYKDVLDVLVRGFRCSDENISFPRDPLLGHNVTVSAFASSSPEMFYATTILLPMVLILTMELMVLLFACKSSRRPNCSTAIVRSVQFSGALLCGYFLTSIVVSILKASVGKLRPYFLDICPLPCSNSSLATDFVPPTQLSELDFCGYELNDTMSLVSVSTRSLRDARMSFPSHEVTLASFSSVFCIVYLNCSQFSSRLSWSRTVRTALSIAAILASLLLANAKLVTNRNHLEDVLAATLIGTIFAAIVTVGQLDKFKEQSKKRSPESSTESPTPPMTASSMSTLEKDMDSEGELYSGSSNFNRYFHIPRVILRSSQRFSRRWRSGQTPADHRLPTVTELRTTSSSMSSTNPVFGARSLVHEDVRFS